MQTIVIGVSSSIACYKALELAEKLKKEFNIEIIMTANACKLIDKKEFEKVLGKKVHTEMFYSGWNYKDYLKREEIGHISLADKADLFVICPATANVIGKIANGIADDLLTASVMATNAPVLVCPAMNCKMWENRIVQENVLKLRRSGYYFVEPEKGKLACGYEGIGRLANIGSIISSIEGLFNKKNKRKKLTLFPSVVNYPIIYTPLKNKKIIVTAGATVEEIDPARVITNKSSGKMGIYIAEEAAKMGASVTLVRGKTEVEPMGKIKDIKVESVDDMLNAIKREIDGADIFIHAAAVSDFTVDKKSKKIKSNTGISLKLKPTIKIINNIKNLNKKVKLIGFKAEFNASEKELVDSANLLLKKADADFIIANDVSKGVFGSEDNEVWIIDGNKKTIHIKGSKREIAQRILELIK